MRQGHFLWQLFLQPQVIDGAWVSETKTLLVLLATVITAQSCLGSVASWSWTYLQRNNTNMLTRAHFKRFLIMKWLPFQSTFNLSAWARFMVVCVCGCVHVNSYLQLKMKVVYCFIKCGFHSKHFVWKSWHLLVITASFHTTWWALNGQKKLQL